MITIEQQVCIKVGDLIKVHFPGETPWATCTRIISKDIIQAQLNNNLFSDKYFNGEVGDLFTFHYRNSPQSPSHFMWEVSPIWEQLPTKPFLVYDGAYKDILNDKN